jgi:hypothetical protein
MIAVMSEQEPAAAADLSAQRGRVVGLVSVQRARAYTTAVTQHVDPRAWFAAVDRLWAGEFAPFRAD